MTARPRVLVVDDDADVLQSIAMTLRKEFEVLPALSGAEALELLEAESDIAVVLTDQRMPEMSGVEFLAEVRARDPLAVRMILTGYTETEDIIAAINSGHAFRYLTKPWERMDLVAALRDAVVHHRLNLENLRLREQLETRNRRLEFDNERLRRVLEARGVEDECLVGSSAGMIRALQVVDQVAPTDAPVLLLGESGTGKELFARALHRRSRRADAPFVAISCGALPEALVESELFGHVKGAFTGATSSRPGRFVEADGGTLFLDEVAELPLQMQVKLLRALQSGEIHPVGATGGRAVNVRILAATHRPLRELVDSGEFREDLYYRLNVVPIQLPALRERPGDVSLLAQRFLKIVKAEVDNQVQEISPEVLVRLQGYDFPGNIRELENLIRRMVILARGQRLELEDLPPEVSGAAACGHEQAPPPVRTNHELKSARAEAVRRCRLAIERRFLECVLGESGGNVSEASRRSGMNRTQLQQMMAEHGVSGADFR